MSLQLARLHLSKLTRLAAKAEPVLSHILLAPWSKRGSRHGFCPRQGREKRRGCPVQLYSAKRSTPAGGAWGWGWVEAVAWGSATPLRLIWSSW